MSSNLDPRRKDPNKKDPEIVDFETIHKDKKVESNYDALVEYVKNNTKESIIYALLVIALLLLLFDAYSPYAGLAIGIIFGLYFANELAFVTNNVKDFIEEYGLVKSFVLAGTLFALFITSPFVFAGIAIVTIIKVLLRT